MTAKPTTAILAAVVLAAGLAGAGGAGAPTGAAAPAVQECSFPVEEVDATGTTVRVEEEPARVVTLNPSAAQTMKEIGAWEKVVGVSKFAGYLEGADEKANVSGAGRTTVVVEKVVALEPDLVLAPNTIGNETVGQLREAGLTVYRFEFAASVEDVTDKTLLTGRLVGECEGAEETVGWMESELETVREAVEGEDRPRVLYVFFGFTAGEGTFIDHMITLAGGENVAATAGVEGYQRISEEVVVEQDPEWIVLNTDQPTVPESDAYNGTTAVQEGNVLVLDTNLLSQPAPRVVIPIRKMAKAFHPEAYAAANATPTPAATPTAEPTPTPTPAATPTPTATTNPGFGPAAAVVALVATLLLARRR